MPSNAFVRARIDAGLKNEAVALLSQLGLMVSDGVRMTLTRIAKERALPFEWKAPNSTTRAAMEDSRAIMAKKRTRFQKGQDPSGGRDERARQRQTSRPADMFG